MVIKRANLLDAIKVPSKIKPHALLEITNYWRLVIDTFGIHIVAYDGANFVRTTVEVEDNHDIEDIEDLDVVINGTQFGNLVRKTTKKTIRLVKKEDHLQFKGNGTYKLPIVPEKYPKFPSKIVGGTMYSLPKLQTILKLAEISTSGDTQDGPLQGYLIRGGYLVTADRIKISVVLLEEPNSKPILLSPGMANLIKSLDGSELSFHIQVVDDGMVTVIADYPNMAVHITGPQLAGIDDFPDLTSVVEHRHPSYWSGYKQDILLAISRVNLVAPTFEDNILQIRFDSDGFSIYSEHGAVEHVCPEGQEVRETGPVDVAVNGFLLEDILGNCGEEVEIEYGSDSFISIGSGDMIYLLATVGV